MKAHYFYAVFWFLLIEPVTLKKLKRASVQIFSGRTTQPIWFLKL
jgi:hypothetical protein